MNNIRVLPTPEPEPLPPPRKAVLDLLDEEQWKGITWEEAANRTGLHHGSVSGALSHLHQQGKVVRLTTERGGSQVYVLTAYADGRKTSPRRRPHQALVDDMADMLARVHRGCQHNPNMPPHPTCKQCEIAGLLARYHRTRK